MRDHPTVERVLRGRDIICFSHDWTGDPLSKTHLMRLLARDNRILWVNSIGYRAPTASAADLGRVLDKLVAATHPLQTPEPHIFVLNALAIPVYGQRAIHALNRRLLGAQVRWAMKRLQFSKPINWTFNPPAAVLARTLGEDRLIYHCVDEYTAFTGVSSDAISNFERTLLQTADLVFVSAERLLPPRLRLNPRTVLLRHGVDFEHFRRSLDPTTDVPSDIAQLPRPVIGFFGLIADWVDVDLIGDVARHFRTGSIVLLGKATTDVRALSTLSNVHMLGRKPYAALPAYCRGFDVALLPFRINELTLSANPLKVREYLAAGLPVVSTPIPEVEVLGLCRIGRDTNTTIDQINAALEDPGPSSARSETMRGESWEARVEDIRRHFAALGAGP